ncbi:malonic semialdehyde reductase [Sphingomonas sp. BIUV-7]|uniref:Putative NADH dehydrogenase/NAD(P)H nitroreductase Q4F19_20360 n=1 Tax=Sphingomonas natans TaxID=3063330 RepID=A0ABT8YEJ0_9SPHN|nr:malonic semialdehyde reductase [Sphingomonas sp. BIUV-7]MDO6416749.1 malonic semialdehyde reductase [Sphingomonas sp. BIUV-7]
MIDPLDDAALDRVFRTARTYNGYTDEPVTEAELRQIYDLMKWGPTSANQSPLRIVWCTSDEAKQKLAAACSAQNAPKVLKAPVTAILGMDMEFYEKLPRLFPHADARAWFVGNDGLIKESAFRNSTLQGAYLIIAARLLGLDTGAMSGFDAAKVDESFFAGTTVKTNFIATLGHGDPASIFDRLPRLDFEEATSVA